MKEKILSVCITILGSFPNVIPFAVELAIFFISAFGALGVGLQHSLGFSMTIALFLVGAVVLNGALAIALRLSNWTIVKFATIGKKYAAPYIIKDVRETYAHNSLSDKARAEVLALLREYGMDGLPEDIKNYIRNQQALEEMITRLRRIEEDRIKKRNILVEEYTRLFFAGRLEDYRSLNESIIQFLVCMDADMRYEQLACNKSYSKADIRVFCSNVQLFCEIPVDVMAKFQEKVFGNWFPNTSLDSLISNFSKTSSSKFSKISDSVSLEEIVEDMRRTCNPNNNESI